MKERLLFNIWLQIFIILTIFGYSQSKSSTFDSSSVKMILPVKINPFCGFFQSTYIVNEAPLKNENTGQEPIDIPCGHEIGDNTVSFPNFGVSGEVSQDFYVGIGCEVSTSLDPTDNKFLLSSYMNSIQGPLGYSYSEGGTNWQESSLPYDTYGDPTAVISKDGYWYICYGQSHESNGCLRTSVQVAVYYNGNWQYSSKVASPLDDDHNNYMLDKPYLCVDNTNGDYSGYLYCAWTPLTPQGCTDYPDDNWSIEISKSTNHGSDWKPKKKLSANNLINSGVNIQIGPEGNVYVVWAASEEGQDEEYLVFNMSSDGGDTYYSKGGINIRQIHGIRYYASENHTGGSWVPGFRLNSFPSMCVDKSGGPKNGTIYIVWANQGFLNDPNSNYDKIEVYMITSSDQGTTWSDPVKVSHHDWTGLDTLNNTHSFFPWISCDDETGVLSVIFYDDFGYYGASTLVAMSNDYGQSWDECRVDDYSFDIWNTNFMGEYNGICSKNSLVYPTFANSHAGQIIPSCQPYVYCSPFYAWDCIDSYLDITNPVLTDSIREWEVVENTGTITARNKIEGGRYYYQEPRYGGVAVFNAGYYIDFRPPSDQNDPNPGFWVEKSRLPDDRAFVHAYIEGCEKFSGNSENIANKSIQNNLYETKMGQSLKFGTIIHPNPNNGKFQVEITGYNTYNWELEITDVSGIVVYSSRTIYSPTYDVDVSALPKGVYFVKVYSDPQTFVRKIITY